MAHMIDMSNGRANMAYVGALPWHGLGSKLESGLSIEQWQVAAGMGYEVMRAQVQYQNGELRQFAGREVLYRSDTSAPLGIVSDGYKIVQPGEVLEFFRDLCEQQGMSLETAGVLKGGALYWALAKTGHTHTINGHDRTEGYVLMSTSADGTRATDNRFTSIRVVCNNTLSIALNREGKSAVRTSHRSAFDATATKQKLGLVSYDAAWELFRGNLDKLTQKSVTRAESEEFFVDLLRPGAKRQAAPVAIDHRAAGAEWLNNMLDSQSAVAEMVSPKSDRAVRGLAELQESYYNAPGAMPGTAYGLVQGVTHYIDHSRGASSDKRLTSAWFGQGDTLKTKAFEAALAL